MLYQKPTRPRSNGHAVVLAVDLVHAEGAGVDLVLPGRDVGGDVLDQAGLDLLAEAAAAPGLEQVGDVALLQQRRQLGLERLVLVDLDVDRDVRVGRHVLVGEVLPQAEARVVVLDVIPGDRDRLGGLRRRRARGGAGAVVGAVDGAVEAPLPEQAPTTMTRIARSPSDRQRVVTHSTSLFRASRVPLRELVTAASSTIGDRPGRALPGVWLVSKVSNRIDDQVSATPPTKVAIGRQDLFGTAPTGRRNPKAPQALVVQYGVHDTRNFRYRFAPWQHDDKPKPRPGRNGPTIAVIAREAGVSVPTVSKVINGRSDVAPRDAPSRRGGHPRARLSAIARSAAPGAP